MVVNCNIKFDNLQDIFFNGNILSGKVELSLNKPKKIKSIVLKIVGKGEVNWSASEEVGAGDGKRVERVCYAGNENYIDTEIFLAGPAEGTHFKLNAGFYKYEFSSTLPHRMPSTFSGSFGKIKYYVEVVLNKVNNSKQIQMREFQVLKQVDLNIENPNLSLPYIVTESKEFSWWTCSSASLLVTITIPKLGYVPGESVLITADINNGSKINVTNMRTRLKKIITYKSEYPRTKEKTEIIRLGKARKETTKKHSNNSLCTEIEIPSTEPTTSDFSLCRLININYIIEIKCSAWRMNRHIYFSIPITIGTTSFENIIQHQPSAPPIDPEPGYVEIVDTQSNANPISPPPSYEEAIGFEFTMNEKREENNLPDLQERLHECHENAPSPRRLENS